MDFDKSHLYPSGFLGQVLKGPDSRPETSFQDPSSTFNSYRIEDVPRQIRRYHMHLDGLYEKLLTGTRSLSSFAFRQEFFEIGFQCFTGARIGDWVLEQVKSPNLTNLHINFIEDTLRMIVNGKRRTPVSLYRDLFAKQDSVNQVGDVIAISKESLDFLSQLSGTDDGKNTLWPSVFQCWISKDGGLEDYVMTLALLFGKP